MNLAAELRARGIDPAQCTMPDGTPIPGKPEAKRERMNKTETLYSLELADALLDGRILAWWFESIKLRLADRTWYTPDFCLLMPDGKLRFVEIKGFLREDAAVKWKVARELYPFFDWLMLRRSKSGWESVY